MDNGTGITENTNNHEGTFTAILQKPTDYVIYEVSVANTGSIDGYLTFTFGDEHNNFNYYKDFYSVEFIRDDVDPDISTDILQPSASFTDNEVLENTTGVRTYKIKVLFKESATGFPDTTTNGDFECSLNLTYSQQAPSGGNSGSSEIPVLRIMETANGTSVDQPVSEYGATNLQQGDLLQFDTEQFYVLEASELNIKMLSRYLINIGDHAKAGPTVGLQDAEVGRTRTDKNDPDSEYDYSDPTTYELYGNMVFSSTKYWTNDGNHYSENYPLGTSGFPYVYDSNSTLYPYISGENGYVNTLSTMGLNVTSGTLLSIEDLQDVCVNYYLSNCPSYLFETTYWLGSSGRIDSVYTFASYNGLNYESFNETFFGLRPVINVTLS